MWSEKHSVFKVIILIGIFNGLDSATLNFYQGSIQNYKVFSLQNPEPLLKSPGFSLDQETVIYAFGFGGTANDASVKAMIGAYLRYSNKLNIILLNWEQEAANGVGFLLYGLAIARGTEVGKQLGQALIKLQKKGLNLRKVHLIGHSLGSQVFATTGREVQTASLIIDRITGLDPAGPFYTGNISLPSLSATCATFVDVIHTNPGSQGTKDSKATVDIWPNCGSSIQPGCENTPISLSGTQIQSPDRCSHDRSWMYYSESIGDSTRFQAINAIDCNAWQTGRVEENDEVIFLGENIDTTARGLYYLSTNDASPYGGGKDGLQP